SIEVRSSEVIELAQLVVDHASCFKTVVFSAFNLVGRARGAVGDCAKSARDLNCGQPDAAADGVDQDIFAKLQVSLRNERIESGDENFGDSGRSDPIHAAGNRREAPLFDDNVLGVRTAGRENRKSVV